MKKFTFQLKKLLIALLLIGSAIVANAYDFEVDQIFYKINTADTTTVSVTYQTTYDKGKSYRGDVVVPSTVTYNGNTYTVTKIGNHACNKCDSLTSFVIPNTVTEIEYSGFENCTMLTHIEFPESLTTIGSSAFLNCSSLSDVVFTETLKTIGPSSFRGAPLTSIYIPRNVTDIGAGAFSGCVGLTSIVVDDENPNYYSADCNAIFQRSNNALKMGCITTVIPSNVKTILSSAFSYCKELTSIVIPDNVTTIESGVFNGCTALTSVQLPSNLTKINASTFYGCTSLESIFIPKTVTNIYYNAFYNCSGLNSIVVEEGNNYYDSRNNCNAIIDKQTDKLLLGCNTTVIPEGVKAIYGNAFYMCKGLTSIHIPNGLTTIGSYAFQSCSNLTEITFGEESVKNIEAGAFTFCTGLTSVDFPNSLKVIGDYAFQSCSNLEHVTLGSSIVTIDDGAFYNCKPLSEIVIPATVTYVGRGAFSMTPNLLSITCLATTPPASATIDNSAFSTYYSATLYVPEEVLDAYANARIWKLFQNKVGIDTKFEYNDVTFARISEKSVCVSSKKEGLYSGMVNVPSNAVNGETTYDVRYVGESAFSGSTELTGVKLPNSVTSIHQAAFQGCTGLTSVRFGNRLDSIASLAFDGCDALQSIKCPVNVPPIMVSMNCFTMAAYDNAQLQVPVEYIRDYITHPRWSEFYMINPYVNATPGDINGDDTVTIGDVSFLIDSLLDGTTDSFDLEAADLNGNGIIDIGDVSRLIDMLLEGN